METSAKGDSEGRLTLLQLPPELREEIIKRLCLKSVLQARLTCRVLNANVEKFFNHFKMSICGDSLNHDQLCFIRRINLKKITFKRVAKPLHDMGSIDFRYNDITQNITKRIYMGPCQFFQVGGVQVRSIGAPRAFLTNHGYDRNAGKIVYDFSELRMYLISIGDDDVFAHMR